MSEIIPTVTIRADNAKGRRIINKSDFDPTVHEIYGAQGALDLKAPAPAAPAAAPTPTPPAYGRRGGR